MSAEKIKHFYFTVSATLTSVLLLLILYGCWTYRKFVILNRRPEGISMIFNFRRRLESLNKRNEILARRRSRGLGDGKTSSNSQNEKHLQQKLLN